MFLVQLSHTIRLESHRPALLNCWIGQLWTSQRKRLPTMTSSRPNSWTALSTAAFTSASLETSALNGMALTSGYRWLIRVAAFSTGARFQPTSKTLAPSDANRIDVSNPMRLINKCLSGIFRTHILMAHPPAPVTIVDCVMLTDKT
jgi:hypothetical protein